MINLFKVFLIFIAIMFVVFVGFVMGYAETRWILIDKDNGVVYQALPKKPEIIDHGDGSFDVVVDYKYVIRGAKYNATEIVFDEDGMGLDPVPMEDMYDNTMPGHRFIRVLGPDDFPGLNNASSVPEWSRYNPDTP